MAEQKLIAAKEFCVHHNIEYTFISDLYKNELIELVSIKKTYYIPAKHLPQLEKMVRLYHDLNINSEGIYTVLHLLDLLDKKEAEIRKLKNNLEFYF